MTVSKVDATGYLRCTLGTMTLRQCRANRAKPDFEAIPPKGGKAGICNDNENFGREQLQYLPEDCKGCLDFEQYENGGVKLLTLEQVMGKPSTLPLNKTQVIKEEKKTMPSIPTMQHLKNVKVKVSKNAAGSFSTDKAVAILKGSNKPLSTLDVAAIATKESGGNQVKMLAVSSSLSNGVRNGRICKNDHGLWELPDRKYSPIKPAPYPSKVPNLVDSKRNIWEKPEDLEMPVTADGPDEEEGQDVFDVNQAFSILVAMDQPSTTAAIHREAVLRPGFNPISLDGVNLLMGDLLERGSVWFDGFSRKWGVAGFPKQATKEPDEPYIAPLFWATTGPKAVSVPGKYPTKRFDRMNVTITDLSDQVIDMLHDLVELEALKVENAELRQKMQQLSDILKGG